MEGGRLLIWRIFSKVMWSSRIPKKPYLLYAIVVVNVLFWLILEISGGSKNVYTLNDLGAIDPASIYSGQYWRLFAAIFMNIGLMHLVVNTISIFIIFNGYIFISMFK